MAKGKKVITVLVVLLMLSTQAHAGVINSITDIATDLGSVATFGLSDALIRTAGEITTDWLYTLFMVNAFVNPLKDALDPDEFNDLLLQCNPKLMDKTGNADPRVANKVNFFIQLLTPFYLLAFLSLALYLMFVSSSPEGRARAKGSILRLILSVAFIIFTIPLIQGLLDISLYFTKFVISTNTGNIEIGLMTLRDAIGTTPTFSSLTGSGVLGHISLIMPLAFWLVLPLLLLILVLSALPFIVIGIRYFMIIVFTLLFPIGIFLFSIHFTQRVGKSIIRQTALWVFIQPLMAIILAVIGIAAIPLLGLIPDSSMKTGFGLAGFVALSATPLLMVGILNWMEIMLISVEAAMEVPLMHIIATTEELEIKE